MAPLPGMPHQVTLEGQVRLCKARSAKQWSQVGTKRSNVPSACLVPWAHWCKKHAAQLQPVPVHLQRFLMQAPLFQLHWEQLSCEVFVGRRKQRRTLHILQDVCGSATSGTLLGIMGPTGLGGSCGVLLQSAPPPPACLQLRLVAKSPACLELLASGVGRNLHASGSGRLTRPQPHGSLRLPKHCIFVAGCGKTTLLSALAGRLPRGGTLRGDIMLNGRSRPASFRRLSACEYCQLPSTMQHPFALWPSNAHSAIRSINARLIAAWC